MRTTNLLTVIAIGASLALGVTAQAKGKKHQEQEVTSSDVPAAVQKAAEDKLKGEKIVRWAKEGANYEAVVEKNGKEWGYTFDANGKSLGKHDETKEEGKKGEKY